MTARSAGLHCVNAERIRRAVSGGEIVGLWVHFEMLDEISKRFLDVGRISFAVISSECWSK